MVDWDLVDAIVDRAPSSEDLVFHRLHLLGASRARALGRPLDDLLAGTERIAVVQRLAVASLLARARAAFDGRMLIMKGPEVAALYRDPTTRPFSDIDLLVDDAAEAQRALLAAGFVEIGEAWIYEGIHHLHPLGWPGLPLTIELHMEPKWVEWSAPPTLDELAEAATPGDGALTGFLRPSPEHHALLLAQHGWSHGALRRAVDLLDLAVMADAADRHVASAVAREWGCARLWHASTAAADGLFSGAAKPLSLRLCGRHLSEARGRTVMEWHLTRWLDPVWVAPEHRIRRMGCALAGDVRPARDETWPSKLTRTMRAMRSAGTDKRQYDRASARPEGLA